MNTIQEVCSKVRKQGSTEYLIKSAIENPKVIIIFSRWDLAQMAKARFLELTEGLREIKSSDDYPMFEHLGSNFDGASRPIVFDNSCFLIA